MGQLGTQFFDFVLKAYDGLGLSEYLPTIQTPIQKASIGVLVLVFLLIIALAVGLAVFYGLRAMARCVRIAELNRRYPGIARHIDRAYRIRRRRSAKAGDWFSVEFPVWYFGNKDGSRDLRRVNNRLVWGTCCLFLGDLSISCADPRDMYVLVSELRDRGANIPMDSLESDKAIWIRDKEQAIQSFDSAKAIVRQFEERPTDFEQYCAELYRRLGYRATVTSRTNDGGYDILLNDGRGSALVECKCFEPSHPVGRPLLQKLYGANATVHAGRLIFITTSSFSAEAREYARVCGVPFECIDGPALVALHERAYGTKRRRVALDDVDWALTWDDIAPYYPPDFER